jgi:hypothetical protein
VKNSKSLKQQNPGLLGKGPERSNRETTDHGRSYPTIIFERVGRESHSTDRVIMELFVTTVD